MAGDWIKIEVGLPDKPEVHSIAAGCNLDPDAVVGKLFRVWEWFDKHTVDGNAHGVTFSLVDRLVGVTGFGEAMQFAGWLEQRDMVLHMPKFDRHTSKSAKKRALTAARQQKFRNAHVTQEELPREEKRRDSKQYPLPPSRKRGAVEFKTWMESCKAAGEKPISEYRAIFDYAESIRLPVDFLQLAWAEFSRRHSPGGVDCRKKKSDWRAYFRKAVEGNWYHLWFHDVSTDQFSLTSNGRSAERATA